MSSRSQLSRRYLDVLSGLETNATPSEKEYYKKVRLKHERILATGGTQAKDDEGPAALAEGLNFGYQALYSMQHDLSKADLDRYWRVWLEEQIVLYKEEIENLENQLRELNYDYKSPEPNFEEIAQQEERERQQQEIEGLEILKALKLSWAERNARVEDVQQELAEIQRQIDQLGHQS